MKKTLVTLTLVLICIAMLFCVTACGEKIETKGDLVWPTDGIGALLPAPASTNGKILNNDDMIFSAEVTMPEKDFKTYQQTLKNFGFSGDLMESDTLFSGTDALEYTASLVYNTDKHVCNITLQAPSDQLDDYFDDMAPDMGDWDLFGDDTQDPEEDPEEVIDDQPADAPEFDAEITLTGDLDTQLKDYEAFLDRILEYGRNNDLNNPTAMAQFSKGVNRFNELTQDIAALDFSKMSKEELNKYSEVLSRCGDKLENFEF